MDAEALLTGLLRDVSRSFYLTLRVLPRAVRTPIGLAYLFARATDTIADTAVVPVDQRLNILEQFREVLTARGATLPNLGSFLGGFRKPSPGADGPVDGAATPAELRLLGRIDELNLAIHGLSVFDQSLIRSVLDTIISGQLLDLRRFAHVSPGTIRCLSSPTELDDYIYRVAGCVGEFWTRICRRHVFPHALVDEQFLLENGVRFGKGLQLTNVLRDLPRDLRIGRCYLPATDLSAAMLRPIDLLDAENEQRFRPLFDRYLCLAMDHLNAGWSYTNHLPRRAVRVRLACAWPLLIGRRTLELLNGAAILAAQPPVKISRNQLRSTLIWSVLSYPWPSLWQSQWPEAAIIQHPRQHSNSATG